MEDGKTRDIVASKLGIGSGKQYEREKSTNKAFNRIKEMLKAAEEKNQEQERKLMRFRKRIEVEDKGAVG